VREKYLRLDLELTYQDFDTFFNLKAEWNEKLDHIKDSTRKKLRQVLFRILTEADIISSSNMILPMLISPRVTKAINDDDAKYFSVFPITEGEVRKYKKP